MPKLKTKKAFKKRFKVTKNGKILTSSAMKRHLLTDRSAKKKRQARKWKNVDQTEVKKILKGLPYDR